MKTRTLARSPPDDDGAAAITSPATWPANVRAAAAGPFPLRYAGILFEWKHFPIDNDDDAAGVTTIRDSTPLPPLIITPPQQTVFALSFSSTAERAFFVLAPTIIFYLLLLHSTL